MLLNTYWTENLMLSLESEIGTFKLKSQSVPERTGDQMEREKFINLELKKECENAINKSLE